MARGWSLYPELGAVIRWVSAGTLLEVLGADLILTFWCEVSWQDMDLVETTSIVHGEVVLVLQIHSELPWPGIQSLKVPRQATLAVPRALYTPSLGS